MVVDPLFHLAHSLIRNPRIGKWQFISLYKMCICSTKEQVERQISLQPAPQGVGPGTRAGGARLQRAWDHAGADGTFTTADKYHDLAGQQDAQPHGGETPHSWGAGAG